MIRTVATFSLSQAREYLGHRWPENHPFADKRRAWVGFDLLGYERSPLRDCLPNVSGPLVLSMADWDPECPHRGHYGAGERRRSARDRRSRRRDGGNCASADDARRAAEAALRSLGVTFRTEGE
jgi:hypothetical protein